MSGQFEQPRKDSVIMLVSKNKGNICHFDSEGKRLFSDKSSIHTFLKAKSELKINHKDIFLIKTKTIYTKKIIGAQTINKDITNLVFNHS